MPIIPEGFGMPD